MIKRMKLYKDELLVNVDLIEFVEVIPTDDEIIHERQCQRQSITAQSLAHWEFKLPEAKAVTPEV